MPQDPSSRRKLPPQAHPGDPRRLALQILQSVLRHGRSLDETLARQQALQALTARDRGFVRLLVATVLRRLGQLDAVIDRHLERSLGPRHSEAYGILRLGAAQLLFLETPPHAAVTTSVALARSRRLEKLTGLVNAVLRRIADQGVVALDGLDAARLNMPPWLWAELVSAYGEPTTRAIAEIHQQDPPIDLSLADPGETRQWAERLNARLLPTGGLRLPSGSGEVARLPGFREGRWWVQDAAATLPLHLLGPLRGRHVLDLCAAPGGKTAALAAAGAEVMAVDRSAERLRRLTRNLDRLKLAAAVVTADATTWRPPEPFELVLLDAPCTATGTLRRHPDIAWLRQPADLPGLTRLQDRLLANAAGMVKPGGILLYVTCSLLPEECEARIEALLASGAPFRREPVGEGELPLDPTVITAAGDLRTLPCHLGEHGGMDGFYACRLRHQ